MTIQINDPDNRLGVLIPGLGAVGTTFIAGIELIRQGFSKPIGSLTQMGTIRLGILKNTLRWMKGEDLITHLGREYYDE